MKLSNRDAQRLLLGLKKVDEQDETKLDGEVRLKLGININRLTPHVQVFEREIQRISRPFQATNGASIDPKLLLAAEDQITSLSDASEDHKLKKITLEDLKLSSNGKIKVETLAQLAPIIKNFESSGEDE